MFLAKDLSLHYYSIKEIVLKREIVIMYWKEECLAKAVLDLIASYIRYWFSFTVGIGKRL